MSLQLLCPRVELPLCELFIKVLLQYHLHHHQILWLEGDTIPHRLMGLNIWSSVGGSLWEVYGTFRMWSLAEGNMSLGAEFEGF